MFYSLMSFRLFWMVQIAGLLDGYSTGKIRQQQGGGGVMMWAGIIINQIEGPFRLSDGVKMCTESYVDFLKKHFLPWYKNHH